MEVMVEEDTEAVMVMEEDIMEVMDTEEEDIMEAMDTGVEVTVDTKSKSQKQTGCVRRIQEYFCQLEK